jgi:hypothetical protein
VYITPSLQPSCEAIESNDGYESFSVVTSSGSKSVRGEAREDRRAEAYVQRYVEARRFETCMMDAGPYHECSGTMAEMKAVVQGRHVDGRRDIHSTGV